MNIRSAIRDDIEHWAKLRNSLWPDSYAVHTTEIENYFSNASNNIRECFLIEVNDSPVGFIELNVRSYAEGSNYPEVPYVEGWYVENDFRGKGLGKMLMAQAETWAKLNGYSELASDAEIDNKVSIKAHKNLGFKETDRIVCFLKKLK
ncbi:MAG: GNAT family N-acetyltransferase [Candidatus Thiodiazotropha sp. (ex Epidulcina cf. delphinae)]|nr:GNAT family N-acetyltransferase [Candidatus Thiodiazotropha sp. (ex Epidulcina cf. delphinae)]